MTLVRSHNPVAVSVTGYPVRGSSTVSVTVSGAPLVRASIPVAISVIDQHVRSSTPVAVRVLGPSASVRTSAPVALAVRRFEGTGIYGGRGRRSRR